MQRLVLALIFGALAQFSAPAAAARTTCDKACLEEIGARYRTAYFARQPGQAPVTPRVRFTENNAELSFPDGSWDTVTEAVGEPLIFSDPQTGDIAIYTGIMQSETPGHLAVRLKVRDRRIVEIEHVISTRRYLSSAPTPFEDPQKFQRDPYRAQEIAPERRSDRKTIIALGDGYFETLEKNNGEIRNTRFAPEALRYENGMIFPDIEKGFKSGFYAFNDQVRRTPLLVDEARGIVLFRAFIDHKGVLDEYRLTDGKTQKSFFREPQSWTLLEMFKVEGGQITGVEANFIQVPYKQGSPWEKRAVPPMGE
jgi:hypothetical protein